MPVELQRCKPRPKPAPYNRKQRAAVQHNAPATSAKPLKSNKHENLTLHDWLTVFAFIDSCPNMPQGRVVEHFKTLQEGALEFTQSTLSRKLRLEGPCRIRAACPITSKRTI
ncbi:hypothetical protein PAXINDRAFT_89921 [Paxillus involutus ATCC 200175]|uniref:Uncharacterized protein n=1 Tax=Paxillus involutus ATCC 200175 TaxID=664439 RepID=A0A0C9SXK2_PAXIN|nr:hypothetical protein PAXINDRAFT_89921 [Paxillus involutus ATCC 200175]